MLDIDFSNRQTKHPVDEARLVAAVRLVLTEEGIAHGSISLAVVDDPTIHQLNRRYLQHDYPTDVLSFVLDQGPPGLEGEVIVSADMAAATCHRYRWRSQDELLLYVIHGTLHLVGYDDHEASDLAAMRACERRYLGHFQLSPRYDDPDGG